MAAFLETPTIIVLILLVAFTIAQIGIIIGEYFTEKKYLKANLPKLFDDIQEPGADMETVINEAEILTRQKAALTEVLHHPILTEDTLDALAIRLLEEEQEHYQIRVKTSDMISRLGPMFGLLGTLIPLGPGIIALSQGDINTLATSLLTAFDTTIAGLASAAVAFTISSVRKSWYADYMSTLEALMECVLEGVKKNEEEIIL